MEDLPVFPLLQVTQEEAKLVKKSININEDQLKKSIELIEEWWKKQDHLAAAIPPIYRDNVIERFILISQGSVEETKKIIERVFTTRTLLPEITANKSYQEFDTFFNYIFLFPMPKTNPKDHSRVFLMEIKNENQQEFNLLSAIRFTLMISELRIFCDYNFSDRFIINLKYFNINMLTKFNYFLLKKIETISTQSYGLKIKGIHIINAPYFVDKFVIMLKQVLSEKLASRIHIHRTYEDLYQEVSREILPQNYGGDAPSVDELNEQWKEYFKTEEAKHLLDYLNSMFVDESKRSVIKFNEEYLGMPGSFRKLTVD